MTDTIEIHILDTVLPLLRIVSHTNPIHDGYACDTTKILKIVYQSEGEHTIQIDTTS